MKIDRNTVWVSYMINNKVDNFTAFFNFAMIVVANSNLAWLQKINTIKNIINEYYII